VNSEPLNSDRQASQVKTVRKIIAILSMFGAGSGLYVIINALFQESMTNRIFLVSLAFFVLASLQVVSGFYAFRDNLIGVNILIVSYIFQLFAFAFGNFAYLISTGPVIFLKYDNVVNEVALDLHLFQIIYKVSFSGDYSFISINLFVLLILIFLVRSKSSY
jgi:hypothetical protein